MSALGITPADYAALPGSPDWVDVNHPTLSKCEVLAWYRLSGRIPAILEHAASKKRK